MPERRCSFLFWSTSREHWRETGRCGELLLVYILLGRIIPEQHSNKCPELTLEHTARSFLTRDCSLEVATFTLLEYPLVQKRECEVGWGGTGRAERSFNLVGYQGNKQDEYILGEIIGEASPISCSGSGQCLHPPGQENGSFLLEAHRLWVFNAVVARICQWQRICGAVKIEQCLSLWKQRNVSVCFVLL
jgi:hypothetical protein